MKLNNRLDLKSKIFFILIFEILFFIYNLEFALGQTMENEFYKVQIENLNSVSNLNASEYNLSDTYDQQSLETNSKKNFKIKQGFENSLDLSPFSFSISNTAIDFGTLSPTNPITRTTKLTIGSKNTQGFSITSAQNHELMSSTAKNTIPDTTCDDGKCSEIIASEWINTLTYGFGYRCTRENSTCAVNDSSFVPEDFFKQFPDSGKGESASTIMSGGAENILEATILYKVNISSSQPSDAYSNVVTFLAIPNY